MLGSMDPLSWNQHIVDLDVHHLYINPGLKLTSIDSIRRVATELWGCNPSILFPLENHHQGQQLPTPSDRCYKHCLLSVCGQQLNMVALGLCFPRCVLYGKRMGSALNPCSEHYWDPCLHLCVASWKWSEGTLATSSDDPFVPHVLPQEEGVLFFLQNGRLSLSLQAASCSKSAHSSMLPPCKHFVCWLEGLTITKHQWGHSQQPVEDLSNHDGAAGILLRWSQALFETSNLLTLSRNFFHQCSKCVVDSTPYRWPKPRAHLIRDPWLHGLHLTWTWWSMTFFEASETFILLYGNNIESNKWTQ